MNAPSISGTSSDVIHAIARPIFSKMVPCFEETDIVAVDDSYRGISITYASPRASRDARDVTRLKCQVDFSARQMWIDDLRVARRLRSNGLGRQLVLTAEALALAFELRTLNVFPLVRARRFWKKMGYTSHPTRARVVKKSLPAIDLGPIDLLGAVTENSRLLSCCFTIRSPALV